MARSSYKAYPFTLLKSVLIVSLLSLIIIIFGLTALFNYQSRQVDEEIGKRLLLNNSQLTQHRLEDFFDRPRQTSNLLFQYLQGSEHRVAEPQFIPEMVYLTAQALNTMPAFKSLSWAEASGRYYSVVRNNHSSQIYLERASADDFHRLVRYSGITQDSTIVSVSENFSVTDQAWFRLARQQASPFWTTTFLSDGPVITYHLPVYDKQGAFRGVIASGALPADMQSAVQHILPGKGYALLIVDEKNNLMMTSGEGTPWQQRPGVVRELLKSHDRQHISSFHINENEYLATVFDVRDRQHLLQWKAVMIAPRQAVNTEMNKQRLMMTFSNMLFIVALIVVLALIISHFTGTLKGIADKVRPGLMSWKKEPKRLFPEIASLDAALSTVSLALSGALDERRKKLEEDSDTGLLTRSGLLHSESLYANRNLLAMVHVSNYNSVKNVLGNELARQLIRQFTRRLREILPQGALCCRDREDLFIIAFAGVYESKDVAYYCALLSSIFRMTSAEMSGDSHIFTGNVGMVFERLTPENVSECLMNVSLALQHAQLKRSGASELFTPQMREEEVNNLRLHQALCDDLQSEGFHLVLQPIVPFTQGSHCKEGECLIRWQSNVLGFVPPDKFIGLAEHTGMIVPLGKWIVETACRELAGFIARGAPQDFKLHVNISAVQLQQPDFSAHLLGAIQRHELMNSNICIEITESVLLHDTHRVVEILAYLRRLGVSVAIDDFGSGYSSLSYLHSLPFDCLKIDRGFVRNVLDDKKSAAVIASVLMLARSFAVPLVVEGVETAEMAAKLHEMGCDLAQGYYYSRPKAFDHFAVQHGVLLVEPE
ncbi:TPA: EAL domain-containing protein [Raoultella ornithinolytica]|nr:EAL domain-containing protein [Raoultella ornithinolytica]